jgi:hypothetical protein
VRFPALSDPDDREQELNLQLPLSRRALYVIEISVPFATGEISL